MLITNVAIVTMREELPLIENGYVVIKDGHFDKVEAGEPLRRRVLQPAACSMGAVNANAGNGEHARTYRNVIIKGTFRRFATTAMAGYKNVAV